MKKRIEEKAILLESVFQCTTQNLEILYKSFNITEIKFGFKVFQWSSLSHCIGDKTRRNLILNAIINCQNSFIYPYLSRKIMVIILQSLTLLFLRHACLVIKINNIQKFIWHLRDVLRESVNNSDHQFFIATTKLILIRMLAIKIFPGS